MEIPTIPIFKKRILIVEDNSAVRQQVARILEIEGYTILQAEDGYKALSLLKKTTPDLIVSDIHLPNLDGIDFYRTVRRDRRLIPIPFIFLTADRSPELLMSTRVLGVEDFVNKPIEPNSLVKIVNARMLRAATIQIALMDQAYLETVTVLANTIEGRDHFTSEHVERVSHLSLLLAKALGWPEDNLRQLEFGARLHDIGKIIIPDQILNKPGPLTQEEWAVMQNHTIAGAKILREIKHLSDTVPYALYHHERWDGKGYPKGLRAKDIPLEGRLLALADVYDAMTNDRPYRTARSKDEVINFLQLHAGSHFDPDLVPIFVQLLG